MPDDAVWSDEKWRELRGYPRTESKGWPLGKCMAFADAVRANERGKTGSEKTDNEVLVYINGELVYKRWFKPEDGPAEKQSSAFFCPWTGKVVLPDTGE